MYTLHLRECWVKIAAFNKLNMTCCLVLLVVERFEATKHRVKVGVDAIFEKSSGNGLFVLDLHE